MSLSEALQQEVWKGAESEWTHSFPTWVIVKFSLCCFPVYGFIQCKERGEMLVGTFQLPQCIGKIIQYNPLWFSTEPKYTLRRHSAAIGRTYKYALKPSVEHQLNRWFHLAYPVPSRKGQGKDPYFLVLIADWSLLSCKQELICRGSRRWQSTSCDP